MRVQSLVIVCAVSVSLSACGSSGSTPTTPTQTVVPPVNRPPVLTSMTVDPLFGVSELTTFNWSASANDPDGDPLTYTWSLAGNPAVGSSGSMTFVGSGPGTFTVTVTDGKGGTASDSRTAMLGNATGTWRGSGVNLGSFTMVLTQKGPSITGTYNDPLYGNGQIDPAQPGFINSTGHIELRTKQAAFTDFTFKGDMDQSGRRITGQIFGSGFNGQAFTMDKQ
jgi:hypothetical protein